MFTTECPRCGREIDVGETECSYCNSAAAPPTADPPAQRPVTQRPPQRRQPAQRARRAPRRPSAWSIPPLYLAILAGFLLGTIGVIAYFTNPDLFGGAKKLKLENIAETNENSGGGSARVGDLEIAGVRTWWDQETEKLKVRALVVNHGEAPSGQVNLKVHLNSRKSRASASPLASFDLHLDEELGPLESRDIEADLASLAHPSALPPWNEIRIELDEQ